MRFLFSLTSIYVLTRSLEMKRPLYDKFVLIVRQNNNKKFLQKNRPGKTSMNLNEDYYTIKVVLLNATQTLFAFLSIVYFSELCFLKCHTICIELLE